MKKEIKKSPFFAKLLEKQVEKAADIKGGRITYKNGNYDDDGIYDTTKYPSDSDDRIGSSS